MERSLPIDPNTGDLTQSYVIPVGSLTGFNSLYIRTKDEFDVWSIYEKRIFYVTDFTPQVIAATEITRAEYFFNTDPGFDNGTDITINPNFWRYYTSYLIFPLTYL